MKARVLATILTVSLFLIGSVQGMCPAMFNPPTRAVMPDDFTHGLLVFDVLEKREQLVLEPAFHGDATDFGMVMPVPSRPQIEEANQNIFKELEDLTNPLIRPQRDVFGGIGFTASQLASAGVTVIEQKDVGDFHTAVLTATDSQALIDWLNENGYTYKEADKKNFEYYVERGGYFFIALKVNLDKVTCLSTNLFVQQKIQQLQAQQLITAFTDPQSLAERTREIQKSIGEIQNQTSCFITGKLKPIEFSFSSERPMLPLRIMASDMSQMTFTMYTLSDAPYYIPGSKVLYSKRLGTTDMEKIPSLSGYSPYGKWLVRNQADFDPKKIREDFFFERGDSSLSVDGPGNFRIVNAERLSSANGILKASGPSLSVREALLPPRPLEDSSFYFSDFVSLLTAPRDTKGLLQSSFWYLLILPFLVGIFFHRKIASLGTLIGMFVSALLLSFSGAIVFLIALLAVPSAVVAFTSSEIFRELGRTRRIQEKLYQIRKKLMWILMVVIYLFIFLPLAMPSILALAVSLVILALTAYRVRKNLKKIQQPKKVEYSNDDYIILLVLLVLIGLFLYPFLFSFFLRPIF